MRCQVAELSPEVKKLLAGAESLYEALKRSKPTQALAVAIRDGVKFDKLQDPEILVMCAFYKEMEKLAAAGTEVATVPAAGAHAANGNGVKPDAIEPPASKPADKKVPKKIPDSAT
jgi:hypothetical protein